MADGEFCSREHRKSYQERLRKIVIDLAECQSTPDTAASLGDSVVLDTPSMQLDPNVGVCGELLPIEAPAVLAAASDYQGMALGSEYPAEALLPADVHPVGLQSQSLIPLWINDDLPIDTWQALPVVSAVGRATPVGSVSRMLPAGFENHARIKRWGLKIKFPKV